MKKSTQVAVGGIASSLCLLLMFLTGIIPFATYALPAMAGAILIAVVIENGISTAVTVYVAVSLLSIFIAPDKEAAMMFIAFFGYYPIIKGKIERIHNRFFETIIKFAVFNIAVISAYLFVAYVLRMSYVLEGLGDFGPSGLWPLLAVGNLMFASYDRALTGIILLYLYKFRPKYLGR